VVTFSVVFRRHNIAGNKTGGSHTGTLAGIAKSQGGGGVKCIVRMLSLPPCLSQHTELT
jgi:hypothetical protein